MMKATQMEQLDKLDPTKKKKIEMARCFVNIPVDVKRAAVEAGKKKGTCFTGFLVHALIEALKREGA